MNSPKEKQRGVVMFFTAEGVSQLEISPCITVVYGEHCDLIGHCETLLRAEGIPKLLNDRQKMERFGAALTHLIRYHNEGDDLKVIIVTKDESRWHHYEPETRRRSLQWKHLNSTFQRRRRLSFPPERLRVAIKNKRPDRLLNGAILLHDNARSHVTKVIKTQLKFMENAATSSIQLRFVAM
ncbi:hypothetical protein TNCV_939641 [Trichonephila clavipes]|nr:hypothetical protein TNCV_939641 [Trichonephila clavipes]